MQCLARVESFLPKDVPALIADITAQDVISVNLQRAVQACVDIAVHVIADRGLRTPDGMAEAFDLLKEQGLISSPIAESLKAATGFRNIAVHEYKKLDWNIVYGIASNHLDDFRRFVEELKDRRVLRL